MNRSSKSGRVAPGYIILEAPGQCDWVTIFATSYSLTASYKLPPKLWYNLSSYQELAAYAIF
jgi:hypothetical protein